MRIVPVCRTRSIPSDSTRPGGARGAVGRRVTNDRGHVLPRLRRDNRRDKGFDGSDVYLIVGLGNPGRRYVNTRHNAGFMIVDRLHELLPGGARRSRFQAEYVETRDGDRKVVLAQPQTFMNDSGVAVGQLARWFKVPRDRLLVVYDELDLPFGTIRLRGDGSAGGHNGMKSIISHLRSQEFSRLRVGIGRPPAGSTVPYVLAPFSSLEQRELPRVIDLAAEASLAWLRDGVVSAMNDYNRRGGAVALQDGDSPLSEARGRSTESDREGSATAG